VTAVGDYPNAAGVRLAWTVAERLNSAAPFVLLADVLAGEPWNLDYSDATRVVAAALRKPTRQGEPRDI
jgi:hypothetical protein